MSKILIAGDTHGNVRHAHWLSQTAAEYDCDRVFQVGDFGFTYSEAFIGAIMADCERYNLQWYWIRGNHDDADYLEEEKAFRAEDMVELWPDIFYVPDGHTWEWEGVKFLACGGAYSMDERDRTPHVSWWPQEMIRDRDVAKCREAGKVDVLFTHDAPLGTAETERLGIDYLGMGAGYKMDEQSVANRQRVLEILKACRANVHFHGHYHHDYIQMGFEGATVIGLNRDTKGERSCAVYDLEAKHTTFLTGDFRGL